MRVVTLLGKQNLLWFFRQNLCAQYSKEETLVFKHAYWLTWGKVELPCNEKNLAFWKFSSVMKYKSWAAPIGRQRLYKVIRFHLGFQVSPQPLLDSPILKLTNQWFLFTFSSKNLSLHSSHNHSKCRICLILPPSQIVWPS